jgi:ATP-dependent helicase/nuclease subunit A
MMPLDQASRELAITRVDRSITLTAGAGSGKTTVLTRRVLAVLAAGVDPARVVAVTFTEKAAGELQARVRDALDEAVRDPRRSADTRAYLARASSRLAELQVGTLHAFCRRLLLLEALAGGMAPGVEMTDDALLHPVGAAAYRAWRAGFERREPVLAGWLFHLVAPGTLRAAAGHVVRLRDLAPVTDPRPCTPDILREDLARAAQGVVRAASVCRDPNDVLLKANADLLSTLRRLSNPEAITDDDLTSALAGSFDGSKKGGAKGGWGPDGAAAFKAQIDNLRAWTVDAGRRLHGVVVRDLRQWLLPALEGAKNDGGVADHDDLLHRARDLLANHAEARARLARRFDALLVDEVQDTDPLQSEVASYLARDPSAEGPWHEHPPRPGHLFAVGDPRQSIYRFRRADVEQWRRLSEVIGRDGETLTLTQNFRSVPGLVSWFNHTFASMDGYVPQHTDRPAGAAEAVVALRIPASPPGAPKSASIEAEFAGLAAFLRGRLDTGEIQASDVMILIPAWTHAPAVQAALARQGVTAVIEGGRSLYGRPEIQALIQALVAIDEPADTESVVDTALSLFGLTLQDLTDHRVRGGSLRYTVPDPPAGPVAAMFGVLRTLHAKRGWEPWSRLLDDLLEVTGVQAAWALFADGAARVANVDRLRARLRELDASARAPSETTEALRQLSEDDNEREQPRIDAGVAAARITTVFSAKGLEAPVVLLAAMRRDLRAGSVAIDRARGTYHLTLSPLEPPGWADALAQERQEAHAEQARWMYVAATRARDQLVVPVHTEPVRSDLVLPFLGTGLSGVLEALPGDLAGSAEAPVRVIQAAPWTAVTRVPTLGERGEEVAQALAVPASADDTGAWQLAAKAAIDAARRSSIRWRSPTDLAGSAEVVWTAGSGTVGKAGGGLLHDVLHHLDLRSPDLARQAHAWVADLASDHGVRPVQRDAVHRALDRIFADPVWNEVVAAPEVWREVPFGFVDEEGRHILGVIDACWPLNPERTRWRVVDWKGDLPPVGTALRRAYERQLGIYARALLATVSPCLDVERTLVGPHPEIVEESPEESVLAATHPALRPGLVHLLGEGYPLPLAQTEVQPGRSAALVWNHTRVAVAFPDDWEPGPPDLTWVVPTDGWEALVAAHLG